VVGQDAAGAVIPFDSFLIHILRPFLLPIWGLTLGIYYIEQNKIKASKDILSGPNFDRSCVFSETTPHKSYVAVYHSGMLD
jgi:hypothetical protein